MEAVEHGPARTVPADLLGLNAVDFAGPRWDDAALDRVLAAYGPGYLRYPGGTVANYWDWRAGWYFTNLFPGPAGGPVDDSLPVFAAAQRATGAQVVFDLDLLSRAGKIGDAADDRAEIAGQLTMLAAAARAGLPVDRLELGNELYLQGDVRPRVDYASRFPTGADYVRQANQWIAALHAAYPSAVVAAIADDPSDVPDINARRTAWDREVIPSLKGADAVTVHEVDQVFDAGMGPGALLALPGEHFTDMRKGILAQAARRHLPVWLDAFNLSDLAPGHPYEGTWEHGLFAGTQALLYLSAPGITLLGLDGSIGDASVSVVYSNDHGFGASGPPTTALALGPVGTVVGLIQQGLRGATTAHTVAFHGAPTIAGHQPGLVGLEARGPSDHELVLLNLTGGTVRLDLGSLGGGSFTGRQLTPSGPVDQRIGGPAGVTTAHLSGTGAVTVAPWAAVTLQFSG